MTTFNACTGLEPTKPPEDDNRLLKIKKLKAKLINEEHRLVLMKKIRQSQTRPVAPQIVQAGPLNSQPAGQLKKLRSPQSGPLALLKNQSGSPSIQGTMMNQTPAHAHQRPKVNTLWNPPQQARHPPPVGIAPPHVGNLSRQPITTPPNVVQAMRGGLTGPQSLLMNASSLSASISRRPQQQQPQQQQQQSFNKLQSARRPITQQSQPQQQQQAFNKLQAAVARRPQQQPQQQQSFNKSQAAQMLLQKRTAAKSAIQKQLEQTLMQLPQKQVSLGIDFVPNANNIEFVYYVGLEACVDYLTSTKNPLDTQPLEKPFECSTCGTDFTPSWSWKRSNAVCENCVGNHVKKSIKNSQASRIKSVLSRAAKQEQDMDQRIMAEATNVVSSPSSTSQQHSLLQPTSHQRSTPQQLWPRMNTSPLTSHQQRSTPQQLWPRMNASPLTSASNSNRSPNVQPAVNSNPLGSVQPAALASLLQLNPQLSTLASLMTANNSNNNNNNPNQFTAQVAALLMNQLTMNLWNKR